MTPSALVLAAALTAWGSVVPEPEPVPAPDAAEPEAATTPGEVEPIAPPPAPPAPAATAAIRPPIIARAPVDVRATPVFVAAPRRTDTPLYKRWFFWVIAGGFLASTIVVTYAATRPGPQPYTGNTPPYGYRFP